MLEKVTQKEKKKKKTVFHDGTSVFHEDPLTFNTSKSMPLEKALNCVGTKLDMAALLALGILAVGLLNQFRIPSVT